MPINNHSTLFQVFTGSQASGNMASVALVDSLPDINTYQLNEDTNTGVYISPRIKGCEYNISWFNQKGSIQRCGHGTLAAAAFLQQYYKQSSYLFHSEKESLTVLVSNDHYSLLLPEEEIIFTKSAFLNCTRIAQTKDKQGYMIAELDNEKAVKNFILTSSIISSIEKRALIITALSDSKDNDIIFRYFAPQYDVTEDNATGSAASMLWPFWANQTGKMENKQTLSCYQASKEGGFFKIQKTNNSIAVIGQVTSVVY